MRVLDRKCVVCGKKLKIKVGEKGKYSGGYYFGPIDKSEKKDTVEYWECEKCFNED